MGELFTDYYNQPTGYHSGAAIENGKTVRYVKLVFDDSDFERFADIFVGKLMTALGQRDGRTNDTKESSNEDISVADLVSDILKEESETKPKPEANWKDWRSCLDAYDMDKITIGVLIKNWKTFTDRTDEYIADFIKTHAGCSVTSVAVNAWVNDRTIPRKRYHESLKALMKLSDKEFDFALENSTVLKAKKRALI